MRILAIDPGPVESAYVQYAVGAHSAVPTHWKKVTNDELLWRIRTLVVAVDAHRLAIEGIASYGMAVGEEVFVTCEWTGRFVEAWDFKTHRPVRKVYRREVKLHLCHDSRAKDANIRQAIVDRYGDKQTAIGTKKAPGPLYGVTGDVWQALAVAITAAETSA